MSTMSCGPTRLSEAMAALQWSKSSKQHLGGAPSGPETRDKDVMRMGTVAGHDVDTTDEEVREHATTQLLGRSRSAGPRRHHERLQNGRDGLR